MTFQRRKIYSGFFSRGLGKAPDTLLLWKDSCEITPKGKEKTGGKFDFRGKLYEMKEICGGASNMI